MNKIILLMAMLLSAIGLEAHTIAGIVKDAATHEPLPGAHVTLKSTGITTTTDVFGRFQFENAPTGSQSIEVTYLGYDKLDTAINVNDNTQPLLCLMHQGALNLGEATIRAEKISGLNTIGQIDISLRPVNSAQDILRVVPGLFIAQHAGGGKAEQIFLRGFDIDHGTDIALSVDGIPVNMVSHAHGQGYADLHFVIPETIRNIDWGKGPYYADKGNFTTAGYVNFQTKDALDASMVKLEAGLFDTYRAVSLLNFGNNRTSGTNAYIASEFLFTNCPFESPQQFNRLNLMAKVRQELASDKVLTLTATTFGSRWDASGQVPQRAVESGLIGRFGAIDDREGGNTSRQNLNLQLSQLMDNGGIFKHQLFLTRYDFTLFSNFTFFLEDSINGDEIRQHEERYIYGYNGEYEISKRLGAKTEMITRLGGTLRHDRVRDVGLAHTRTREVLLEQLAFGDVDETNAGAYAEGALEISQKCRLVGGLRYDAFNFSYGNRLDSMYSRTSQTKGILSPKFTASYQFTPRFELFAKTGTGFHSNDTRVVVAQEANKILPRAIGADVGTNLKPLPKMLLRLTSWYLYMEQEFVYVGDAGIVEPSGRTERKGVEVSLRYQILSWLYADADVNYNVAEAIDEAESENSIPLAPNLTSIGGLTMQLDNGLKGSLRYRYMGDRPANEDGSITAKGYFVIDATASYDWQRFFVMVAAENLLNTEWNEAQFATESRLSFEPEPVEELHFTPGTPFFIKVGVGVKF